MSQEPCLYYRAEVVNLRNQTIKTDLDLRPSKVVRREWFAHPKSIHHRQSLGPNIPCGGEPEGCTILDQ